MNTTTPNPIKAGWLATTAAGMLLSTAALAADIEYPGFIKVENFDNVSGDPVANLLAAPRYIANDPDSITFLDSLYWARNPGADNYGSRITGYITPKDTADYVFFVASDNNSSLYLSTDSTPANLKLIAADQGWQNARTWTGPGGTTSGDGTTNVVFRRGFNPGPDVLAANGFVWVGPFQNRSDEFLKSSATNLLTGTQPWPTTNASGNAVINLVANQKYYFQYLFKEGGGGDNAGVAWKKASDPDPANGDPEILAEFLSVTNGTTVAFKTQPVSVTVGEQQIVNFSVSVLGVPGDSDATLFTYQWFSNNVAIPDATTNIYTIPSTLLSMNGSKYKVTVTSAGTSPAGILTATSTEATLNVIVDNTAPTIARIRSSESKISAKITFSEAVRNEAVNPANYVFTGGLTVTNAVFDIVADAGTEDPKNPLNPLNRVAVILFTTTQTEGATNTLTLNNVKDLVGNNLTPNTATMYANVFQAGILNYKRWSASPGGANINNVATLIGNPLDYENPKVLETLTLAETATPDSSGSGNYVSRASGFFIPAVTTNYVIFMCADNNGFTYLSTDADPANRKLIAADVGWQNARIWTGSDGNTRRGTGGAEPFENRSDQFLTSDRAASGTGLPGGIVVPADGEDPEPWPTTDTAGNAVISLTAGTRYAFELWHEEFEGGRAEATFKIAGEPDPVNASMSTITGGLIGALVDPSSQSTGELPTISVGRNASGAWVITYTGTLVSAATANGNYADVAGATSPYTLTLQPTGQLFYRSRQ